MRVILSLNGSNVMVVRNGAHVDCIPRCGDTAGIFFCPPCKRILQTSYK